MRLVNYLCLVFLVSLSIIFAEQKHEETLALPGPLDLNDESFKLKLGETKSMDELGPIIVNKDGTLRRISNWNILTAHEKESSFRQIAARNMKRIAALELKQKQQEDKEPKQHETEEKDNIQEGDEL
jgi:predicted Fe-S protein YdhL (DUF1289 family)